MSKIHEALKRIQTNLVAPKGQTNSFGNYKYRSCEDILEAVKPLLKETETILVIQDEIVNVGDRYYVRATVSLKSGEPQENITTGISSTAFARECLTKKGMDEAQITGAASSYARKYALNGLFCIDDTKDADTQDNRNTEQPRNTETPSRPAPETKESVPLLKTAMDLAKNKFKELDDFKAWRIDAGLAEDLTKATDYEVSRVIMKLKEIK